jgi:D-beta-D-heptose 7-phosphate kinase/D-beta-D-heptose 1-phosphate adenosyltransferase
MNRADILQQLPLQRIAVVGDVMLDAYIWGDVRRISPEAPVPVVEEQNRSFIPGGAANVAVNIASLGAQALLAGVTGDDEHARILHSTLHIRGVDTAGMVVETGRPTTTKTRIMAHSHQLLRVDAEHRTPISNETSDALAAWFAQAVRACGSAILSDYGKGLLTPQLTRNLIGCAAQSGVPLVVDPKGTDYSKYAGTTVLTPNLLEAERATGIEVHTEEDLMRCAAALQQQLPGTVILITRGAQGMSLFQENRQPVHVPSVARTVYDVTGAGDTVISVLASAIAAGASLPDAAALASAAAGVVVGKLGTSTLTLQELQEQTG